MDGVDRISELPESILHYILSFLPFRQVARISVLSQTWKKIWLTYPELKFGRSILSVNLYPDSDQDDEESEELQRKRRRLFRCLEQTLRDRHSRGISLKKFTLDSGLFDDPDFASFVDRCIFYAVGSDVKELRLEFVFNTDIVFKWLSSTWFNLPQIVLCTQSIQVLKLGGCKLELPRTGIHLSSLRELCLSGVSIDDHLIDNLVYACPLIEDLSICSCEGFQSLKLSGLSRLNRIDIKDNHGLRQLNIEAMNIHSLAICWSEGICDVNVAYCYNIKHLSLHKLCIRDEWLCKLISGLPLLKSLSIVGCFELKSVKISSPCLKELHVRGCLNLVELKIDTPNLQDFEFYGDKAISLSFNALALSNVALDFVCWDSDATQWFFKYIEFLAKFHHFSRHLFLGSWPAEEMIVSKELREILSSPLSSVKHLSTNVMESSNTAKIVDELLWISPHTKTISVQHEIGCSYLEFSILYKKQLVYEGNFASCCKSYPISCWQHCIEEVKVKITIPNFQNEKSTKSYILRGADILEQIDALCVQEIDAFCMQDMDALCVQQMDILSVQAF